MVKDGNSVGTVRKPPFYSIVKAIIMQRPIRINPFCQASSYIVYVTMVIRE